MKMHSYPRGFGPRLILAGVAMLVAGCSAVSFNERLLVKVQAKNPQEEIGAKRNGWHFRRIAQAPAGTGDWYVAYTLKDGQPYADKHSLSIFQLFGMRWDIVHRLTPNVAEATRATFGSYPIVVEPSFVFYNMPQMMSGAPNDAQPPQTGTGNQGGTVAVTAGPNTVWPAPKSSVDSNGRRHFEYDPVWWKGHDFTQLDEARTAVEDKIGPRSRVRLGFIDTGFDGTHRAFDRGPGMLEDEPQGDADGWAHGRQPPPRGAKPSQATLVPPGQTNTVGLPPETHATGTLGLLAGGRVRFDGQNSGQPKIPLRNEGQPVYLGGAPHSVVVPVRVAPSPVSLETAAIAYAIDHASRVKGCDVISMSHGGAPTLAWADAVNAAYERGTAIFAAESDWFRLSPEVFGLGTNLPLPCAFYPAGFRRVMGVTGATSQQTNYAVKPFWALFGRPWAPLNLQAWALRGSYGPDGWSGMAGVNKLYEDPEEKSHGKFRAWPLAAYGPNTMWLGNNNAAGLNGSGTSSATPQVAAAAALWLDYNHNQIGKHWHDWKKAEAVYQALLSSASRRDDSAPDRYLGAGIVKAREALKKDYDFRHMASRPSMRFPVPSDDFDARKSFRWLLLGSRTRSQQWTLAQFDVDPAHGTPLERMYYNSLLLEKWHRGVLPYMALRSRSCT